jgi:hypothetical protein
LDTTLVAVAFSMVGVPAGLPVESVTTATDPKMMPAMVVGAMD